MRDRLESLPMPDVPVSDPAQVVPHFASVGALFAVLAGWLPYFVAIIPAIYYCILIYESKTVQAWVQRRRIKRRALRIARAVAAKKVADAKVDAQLLVNATAAKVAVDEAKSS